jgi:betaine-aldehyde dehydrogenase
VRAVRLPTSYVRREPLGVVGSITPWNYPMMMATWEIGPALAAGNTMVLKPSDTTPAGTVRLEELFAEVLPAGVFNVVRGDRGTGALLSAHPAPALVAITGSTRAGKAVAAAAAPKVTRVHLELGGNAPVVVFANADGAAAAEEIAVAGFFNAGQDCTAPPRVLAHESIADELAEQATGVRFSRDEDYTRVKHVMSKYA